MNTPNYLEAAAALHGPWSRTGAFLTVRDAARLNTMTISWWNIGFIWQRPILTVGVRPTRHTFSLIEAAGDFTVSIPDPNLPKPLAYCGAHSGRDGDKFAAAGLRTREARQTRSPIIRIPGVHYECRIVLRAPIDPAKLAGELSSFYPDQDFHTFYFGQILETYCLTAEDLAG